MASLPPSPVPSRSCQERFLQFVLDCVLHDFANATGGIVSLTEHHLEQNELDSRLQTSLGLIRDSAERCRIILAEVNSVLHPSANEEAYLRADALAETVVRLLRTFLPRMVRVAPLAAGASEAVIRVIPPEFHRRWLAIAGIECDGLGARSEVGFGTRIDGKLCWFSYRSSNPHWQESAPEAKQVLLPLAGSPERLRCQPCEQGFVAEIALPVEFGA